MSQSHTVAAVVRLRAALEQTAASLASPRLDGLLGGEEQLELALAEIPAVESLSPEDRRELRVEIEAAAVALRRCRRLGAALSDFARLTLEAQGMGAEYGPRGDSTATYGRLALDTRV
jgi:hypothetical protein